MFRDGVSVYNPLQSGFGSCVSAWTFLCISDWMTWFQQKPWQMLDSGEWLSPRDLEWVLCLNQGLAPIFSVLRRKPNAPYDIRTHWMVNKNRWLTGILQNAFAAAVYTFIMKEILILKVLGKNTQCTPSAHGSCKPNLSLRYLNPINQPFLWRRPQVLMKLIGDSLGEKIINLSEVERNPLRYIQKSSKQTKTPVYRKWNKNWNIGPQFGPTGETKIPQFGNPTLCKKNLLQNKKGMMAFVLLDHKF